MSTGAYGIEATWEGQSWIVKEFHRLTVRIGQDVAGTLRSTKKDDAIREAGTPPTRGALDRRTDRHFIRLVSNSVQHPCQSYIEGWDQVDDEPDTMDSWLRRSSEGLWSRGQGVEHTTPLPILYTPWTDRSSSVAEIDTRHEVHLYTDGSYRETAGYGCTLRDSTGTGSIVAQIQLASTRQPTMQRWQLLKKALKRFLNPNKHLNIYQSSPTQHLRLLA
jgi:hypothetical protein